MEQGPNIASHVLWMCPGLDLAGLTEGKDKGLLMSSWLEAHRASANGSQCPGPRMLLGRVHSISADSALTRPRALYPADSVAHVSLEGKLIVSMGRPSTHSFSR